MSHSTLIVGPTGLIGSTVLRRALADDRFPRVVAMTRRPLEIRHPKLEEWHHADLVQALCPERVDAVICCLGTTMRSVGGDKAKFIHVDKELVLEIGSWARRQDVPVFCVVSAIGADAGSRIFYNRVKGEMENGLKEQRHPVLHIFQPSILTGPRKEVRIGERLGIAVARLFSPVLPARYRPMPYSVLAAALLNAVFEPAGGTHDNTATRALANRQNTM